MPLDSNGIHQYVRGDLASPFEDTLNLLAGSTSDAFEDDRARLTALEAPPASWAAAPLAPGWKRGQGWQALIYRKNARVIQLLSALLVRDNAPITLTAGNTYPLADLPAGYWPAGVFSYGVVPTPCVITGGGTRGSGVIRIELDGRINLVPYVTVTLDGSGSFGNSVTTSYIEFPAA